MNKQKKKTKREKNDYEKEAEEQTNTMSLIFAEMDRVNAQNPLSVCGQKTQKQVQQMQSQQQQLPSPTASSSAAALQLGECGHHIYFFFFFLFSFLRPFGLYTISYVVYEIGVNSSSKRIRNAVKMKCWTTEPEDTHVHHTTRQTVMFPNDRFSRIDKPTIYKEGLKQLALKLKLFVAESA